jgi:hypothetical protein
MGIAVDVRSVYVDGRVEALRHKWIQSERAQRDLGQAAIQEWIQQHWLRYLRARWLEHIQGRRFWVEFDPQSFAVLQRQFPDPLLLDRILDRLEAGQENLDIIQWSLDWRMPMDRVLEILEALDVNSCRMSCHFNEGD